VTPSILRLLFCLYLFLAFPVYAEPPLSYLKGDVNWIYDGDTLEIETIGTVRLVGIDVPEHAASERDRYLTRQGIAPARLRAASQAAREFNMNQVLGKRVRLEIEDPSRDRYGRLLAYVLLPDGRLLNRVLIEQGLAVVYRRFAFRRKTEFLKAEEQAREGKRGLWAE
jgi:micrococcal nuclease